MRTLWLAAACNSGLGLPHLNAEVLQRMNWDRVQGNWKQVAGKAREQWGKRTDSDWETIGGQKDQLVGRIQERYGIAKDEANRQADAWLRTMPDEETTAPKTGHAGGR